MRAHPAGDRLDERRAAAFACAIERRARHGEHGKDVVSVDADRRNTVTDRPMRDGCTGLQGYRFTDGPLVVLAEEDNADTETGGKSHRLGDVTLTCCAVTEVGDRCDLGAVQVGAERISGGVQTLGADDDRRVGDAELFWIPTGMGDSAPHGGQQFGGNSAAVRDGMFAIAGEGEVAWGERSRGTDLRGFLTEHRSPQPDFALTLQGNSFGVDAATHDEIAIQRQQFVRPDVRYQAVRIRDGTPVRRSVG